MGDRLAHLAEACRRLERGLLRDVTVSSVYETEPLYVTDQPLFLNAVVRGISPRGPRELLEGIAEIEGAMGRVRTRPKGPRVVDIDILLFGEEVIREADLTVPHPGMTERAFVLVPLLELDPLLTDPVRGVPYARYLDRTSAQGVYYRAPLIWRVDDSVGEDGRESGATGIPAG